MIPKKVILDCDPGSDDAIAMMLAMKSDAIDLIGVTTVNGNRIVPKTTENAHESKRSCLSRMRGTDHLQ